MEQIAAWLLIGITVISLYAHFRWTTVDPHNPAARPGKIYLLLYSFVLVMMFGATIGLVANGRASLASLIGLFVVGAVASPAISTPHVPRVDEQSSALQRWLETKGNAISGSFIKMLVVMPLAAIGSFFELEHPEFWVVFILAGFLSFAKMGVMIALSSENNNVILQKAYNENIPANSILKCSLTGLAGLIVWYSIAYPIFAQLPPFTITEWLSPLALWLGLAWQPS